MSPAASVAGLSPSAETALGYTERKGQQGAGCAKMSLGDRLVAGQWTLDPLTEVRILVPQPFL